MGIICYRVKEKNVRDIEFGKIREDRRVVIMEEYTDDNGITIEIPSCLNKYTDQWKNKSINIAKNAANVICPFLNYVKMQVIEEDDDKFNILRKNGLFGLNFYHASKYLNYCIAIKKIKESTSKQYTNEILNFYCFLNDLNLLDKNEVRIESELINILGKSKKVRAIKNPFKKQPYFVYYPDKTNIKLTKIVNMEEHLWQLFLEVAEKVAPEILLGIAFEMFGGIRRGETVNLAIEDIKLSRTNDISRMNLKIQDRQQEFFIDRNNIELSKCEVKRPRPQIVFNFNGQLYKYYERHIELRNKILENKHKITNALFIEEKGLPMDGARYEKRWLKVKREFLKILESNSYSYYAELGANDVIWGTHIGRGIFSNLCLSYGLAKTARELANLRGDKFEDSSKPYIDQFRLSNIIIKTLNVITEDIEKI